MRIIIILSALFACALAASIQEAPEDKRIARASCGPEFQKLGELRGRLHTMCDPKYNPVVSGSVSDEEINDIVNMHNMFRSDPKTDNTSMAEFKIYWDPEMAKIAQHLANSCPDDQDRLREVPGYNVRDSQNIAWGFGSWRAVIQAWFDEVNNFDYNQGYPSGLPIDIDKPVCHYVTIVKDTISRVGCGFADCPVKQSNRGGKTFVCNYAAVGHVDVWRPFASEGPQCALCPDICTNNLCDCQGKICYNGGTLNMNTCTCSCKRFYEGDSCQTYNCEGASDAHWCRPQHLEYKFCPDLCPILCGDCKADGSPADYYIPVPDTQLIAGDGQTPEKPTGDEATIGTTGEDTGGFSGDPDCVDRDWCDNFGIDECSYGDTYEVVMRGEIGNHYVWCRKRCGL